MKRIIDGTKYSTDDALKVATADMLDNQDLDDGRRLDDDVMLYLNRDGTYFLHYEGGLGRGMAEAANAEFDLLLGDNRGIVLAGDEAIFPIIGNGTWEDLGCGDLPQYQWTVHDADKWRDVLTGAGLGEGSVQTTA